MRAEIEQKIAELESQLNAERQKLQDLLNNIPTEFHNMTREVFDRIKSFFEGV